MDKSILDMVHDSAKDLHAAGVMKETTLRELDALCLPPVKEFSAEQIKRIRMQVKASQGVFAVYLNTSKSTV
ncbi:MAG: transcriptional regulator [Moraxellaceae bacterium]|nr:transcriptional regulator [Moraxellaceae bacterium]